MNTRSRTVWILLAGLLLLVSCADEKAVNAAFFQNKVSWYVFDPASATGVQPLAGFDQPLQVVWKPAPAAILATDLEATDSGLGALAVSGLGLLILDDSSGLLTFLKPASDPNLKDYRTGVIFRWDRKTFVTLYRETQAVLATPALPSVTLAWWSEGNDRLAFYPVLSQSFDTQRQAVRVDASGASRTPATVDFEWKIPTQDDAAAQVTRLDLATGTETSLPSTVGPELLPPPAGFEALSQRLAARLGAVDVLWAQNGDHRLLLTAQGWAATGLPGGDSRLYHLPEIGAAGRYTHVLALARGYALSWETRARGFVGAAGLVYVPYGVLAP
ncbi:MAG: hypothetical protein WCG80_07865 [Spirochaetales bacterium]